jgi:hypothetical protein
VIEVERALVATTPGARTLPAPEALFVHAAGFVEGIQLDREPVDPREARVVGDPIALEFAPLPEEGRPADFRGAIGRFSLRAASDRTEVAVGERFRLSLRIAGEGTLPEESLPRVDDASGFHAYATSVAEADGERLVTYELAALSAHPSSSPPLSLAYFDPEPPVGYRVARAEPVALAVLGPPSSSPSVPPRPAGGQGPRPTRLVEMLLAGGIAGIAAAALVVAIRRRRARARASAAGPTALDVLRTSLVRPEADVEGAFTAYAAAVLRCPPAAVVGPDFAARLAAAGVDGRRARRAADLVEALVASRYGGSAAPPPEAVLDVATDLDAALSSATSRDSGAA